MPCSELIQQTTELIGIFFLFSHKIGFDTSNKLSPEEILWKKKINMLLVVFNLDSHL